MYKELAQLAALEGRSIARQALFLIKEGLKKHSNNRVRRKSVIAAIKALDLSEAEFTTNSAVRQDRSR